MGKPKKGSVKPKEVGPVYFQYCKKNMKVSSAKSMDELCQPMVKKIEEKMVWVPSDTDVTPEIVCKTADELKTAYPDHASTMGEKEKERLKEENAAKAAKDALAKKAKDLSAGMAADLKAVLEEASK